ncbi:glycosyltransferase [Silvanigrella aquatica]|nr:glycosyltransferase [Silvanigrella aquatica]
MSNKKNIAIVVQRCSKDIAAGAELYAFHLAQSLAEQGLQVEILTSKSDDYINWNNNLPSEEIIETSGVSFKIKRFKVLHGRFKIFFGIIKRFNLFLLKYFNFIYLKLSVFLDYLFLRSQGPWCPGLWNELEKNSENYSLVIIKSYLYAPNYYAIKKISNKVKTLFIVTAHDQPEFRFQFVYKFLLEATTLGFVSQSEKKICNSIWLNSNNKNSIILPPGIHFNTNENQIIQNNIKEISTKKYFIYIGRIDRLKNIDFIIKHTPQNCSVVFAGDLKYTLPKDPRFIYVGKINDIEKELLLKKALALVISSRYEAYSMITAEAIYHDCFVLALKGCAPIDELIEHYGGLSCEENEFKNIMQEIWDNKLNINKFKKNQTKYFSPEKNWNTNAIKIIDLLNQKKDNFSI